jgi:N-methylhydantoinase A
MGIRNVVVPIFPGLFSALGLLLADYRQDYVSSVAQNLAKLDAARVLDDYERLRKTARKEMQRQGVPIEKIRFELKVDLKYCYQSSELTLPFDSVDCNGDLRASLGTQFNTAHQTVFDYHLPNEPIELVSIRLRAFASSGDVKFSSLVSGGIASPSGYSSTQSERETYFGPAHGFVKARLLTRAAITREEHGPIILDEPDTTVVVPPGWLVRADALNNLQLRME